MFFYLKSSHIFVTTNRELNNTHTKNYKHIPEKKNYNTLHGRWFRYVV